MKKEVASNDWQCANKNQSGDEGKIHHTQRKVNTYTLKGRILEKKQQTQVNQQASRYTIKQSLEEALQKLGKNNEKQVFFCKTKTEKKVFKLFIASWRQLAVKVDVKKEL